MRTMKPNCIIIGAMKAGTTSLHHYLDAHPEISMTKPKETHFFSKHWKKGEEWYLSHFEDMNAQVRGEASPSYSKFPLYPEVPTRMHDFLPDVKIIYLLRDPIERIISHYQHGLLAHGRDFDINTAIQKNPEKYLAPSKYYMQLSQYLEYYELFDILILTSENLRNNTEETMQRAYAFLGVNDSFSSSEFQKRKYQTKDRSGRLFLDRLALDTLGGRSWLKPLTPQWAVDGYRSIVGVFSESPKKQELNEETKNFLQKELQNDVSQLRELTGREFVDWSV